MANILYIHGYGSSGIGDTATAVKRYLPKDHVVTPTFDYKDCDATVVDEVIEQIRVMPYKFDAIIASSFGGYIASRLTICYPSCPMLLINPCLRPTKWISKFTNKPCYLQDAEIRNSEAIVIEGTSDEVLNDTCIAKSFACKVIELHGQCHRLTPDTLQTVIKMFRLIF